MYYSTDQDGNIIFSNSSDILPDQYQEVFPDFSDEIFSSDLDEFFESVSDGDAEIPSSSVNNQYFISASPEFDYDYLYDMLAAIPQYNLYPNATAVNIFTQVLNHLDHPVGYVITAGSSSADTYLYFSDSYEVSGSTITLKSPVTQCRYYYYTQNSTSYYTYNVSTIGTDETVSLSNRLVFTNLKDGYPDVIPYKQKESYSFLVSTALLVGALIIFIPKFIKKLGGK